MAEGQFFAVPPMMGPPLAWRPEYGTIEDPGRSADLGNDIYAYGSPNFSVAVNSCYVITTEGVIVFDSQMLSKYAEGCIADIRARTDKPIKYVVNSHHHLDHVMGNALFQKEGAQLVSSYSTARMTDTTTFWYMIIFNGLYGGHMPPQYTVARDTFVGKRTIGKVELFEVSDSTTTSAESVDNTFMWIPEGKVLCVSDSIWPRVHAYMVDGVSMQDWLYHLEDIRALCKELKPRVIVPGHGPPGDVGMIDDQIKYIQTVTRLVKEHTKGGEIGLTDDAKAQLRADICGEFPTYQNHIVLDFSLQMIQFFGPISFLTGHPNPKAAPKIMPYI